MTILRSGDFYLLLQRSKQPNVGKYVPVGGKLEAFERPQDAAIRETFEETGIRITNARFCGVLSETSPADYNWLCYIYLAEVPWQEAPFCDEGELAWIPLDALHTIPTPPTDLAIYDYVSRNQPFVIDAVLDADLRLLHLYDELSGIDLAHFIP